MALLYMAVAIQFAGYVLELLRPTRSVRVAARRLAVSSAIACVLVGAGVVEMRPTDAVAAVSLSIIGFSALVLSPLGITDDTRP